MSAVAPVVDSSYPQYRGLRLGVEEFLQIPDDGFNYELVDGVVVLSPSPTPKHQAVAGEIFNQLYSFLRTHPVGKTLAEIDVYLGKKPSGGDLVYKPEIVFLRSERWAAVGDVIEGPPDLIVEVVSRGSRRFDRETKKSDYERYGVREYWIIDPERRTMNFYRLQQGQFVDVPPVGETYSCVAVPGFVLDLRLVRDEF